MHDHLDEMGRNIVRRLHPDEPNRHSRLWVKEEIEEIIVNNLGTKDTRSMIMEDMDVHPAIVMQSLRKMKNLRLLFVTNDVLSKNWEIVEGGVQYLPDTLRSLHWSRYPLCCLPKTFQANNLVNLEMPYSYISQLWEGGERKSFSASICGLPSSSGDLERLISFGLCGCTNSEYFSASICGLKHLTALALDGNIPEAPKYLWKLKSLEKLTLSMKEIKHLPDNICTLKRLKSLDLKSCWLLEQLPMDLGGLECLEELHLTDCVSLRDIPDSICKIICLKLLNIEGAGISRLPESIFQLKDLRISMEFW
ncbi:hypothetical protein E3N88_09667 [Mikania micrantha]|uniref:Disease resistance R13L4/SHOC-2-like LRR domain-containing protein n=1 Tax=Mikania micrantha TaxID=192012 RepID=A0A5N6PLP6_9ASTR|nr:hypothetical protein E3N88_09667 [Mikania micrantha]